MKLFNTIFKTSDIEEQPIGSLMWVTTEYGHNARTPAEYQKALSAATRAFQETLTKTNA